MKMWNVYLTMEFTATVEADTEDEARDILAANHGDVFKTPK